MAGANPGPHHSWGCWRVTLVHLAGLEASSKNRHGVSTTRWWGKPWPMPQLGPLTRGAAPRPLGLNLLTLLSTCCPCVQEEDAMKRMGGRGIEELAGGAGGGWSSELRVVGGWHLSKQAGCWQGPWQLQAQNWMFCRDSLFAAFLPQTQKESADADLATPPIGVLAAAGAPVRRPEDSGQLASCACLPGSRHAA